MMKNLGLRIVIIAVLSAPFCGFASKANLTQLPKRKIFKIVSPGSRIVIEKGDPGTEDNKYGFEGGRVVRINKDYHLVTAERAGDPKIVKMRLAHWKSRDGISWQRVSTLYESSGEFEGKDPRAALWGPMPIFDKSKNRWYLVYVAYRAKPNDETGWYLNHEGKIWLAESQQKGRNGIDGPYKDLGIILQPDENSGPWEGLQGTDSFFPYKIDDTWYGFYGSAQTQADRNMDYPKWCVGLAKAESLQGPWERMSERNPIKLDPQFAENPVVTRLKDGRWVAMVDGGGGGFKYSVSDDGLHWSRAVRVPLERHGRRWWSAMRTPLCLIPEGEGIYTVFHTAYTKSEFANVGMAKLKLIEEEVIHVE
ncbi:hypothetical protein [Sedimentisphaera salicampi]|nr:hypothetical protein [Sedimentisphaera salicampi]